MQHTNYAKWWVAKMSAFESVYQFPNSINPNHTFENNYHDFQLFVNVISLKNMKILFLSMDPSSWKEKQKTTVFIYNAKDIDY